MSRMIDQNHDLLLRHSCSGGRVSYRAIHEAVTWMWKHVDVDDNGADVTEITQWMASQSLN